MRRADRGRRKCKTKVGGEKPWRGQNQQQRGGVRDPPNFADLGSSLGLKNATAVIRRHSI
jgi:hypothetical protein